MESLQARTSGPIYKWTFRHLDFTVLHPSAAHSCQPCSHWPRRTSTTLFRQSGTSWSLIMWRLWLFLPVVGGFSKNNSSARRWPRFGMKMPDTGTQSRKADRCGHQTNTQIQNHYQVCIWTHKRVTLHLNHP